MSEELCAAHCSVSRPRPPIVATGGSTASLGGGRFTPKSSTAGAFGLGARAVIWTHLTPAADHLGPKFRAFPGDRSGRLTSGSLYILNHGVSEHMCTSSPCSSPNSHAGDGQTRCALPFTSTKRMRVQCPVGHVYQYSCPKHAEHGMGLYTCSTQATSLATSTTAASHWSQSS